MRIAVGALLFEGNSFSARTEGVDAFERTYLFSGENIFKLRGGNVEVSGALSVLDHEGVDILPLIAGHGGAGGRITDEAYETLVERMLARLAGTKVDGVYLALHGAMACETIERPEVQLLRRLRAIVGDIPIVISLDLHASVDAELVGLCDAIVCYQTYPHDDAFETGARAAGLLLKALGGTTFRMAYRKLALMITPTMGGTRTSPAMREFYKACRALESTPGIASVSYFMLTGWLDLPDGGSGFLIVADDPAVDLDAELERLCDRMWQLRQHFVPTVVSLTSVVEETRALPMRPVIMSDMSDAVGAGACGDSAGALAEYLATGCEAPLLAQLSDPETVEIARAAGVGSTVTVALGNKIEHRNGPPLELTAEIVSLHDGVFYYSGGVMGGVPGQLGPSVVLRSGPATVLVTSRSAYEYGYEQYTMAGLDPLDFKYVLVKNPMNFRQAFAWAPRLYALDRPGAACADLTVYDWEKCIRPFFPLDDAETPIYRH